MKNFYTTKEFAEELELTDAYVRQLILGGKVESEKVGRDHLIPSAELEKARQRRTRRGPEPKNEASHAVTKVKPAAKKATARLIKKVRNE